LVDTHSHPLLGELAWNDRLGWWECDSLAIPMFGGVSVQVTLTPDAADRAISPDMDEAAAAMLALDPEALQFIVPHLWQNYRDCTEMLSEEDFPQIADNEDILGYVRPSNVAFERNDDGRVYLSLECNCDWEIEHGLQLVLQDGRRWVKVSNYDGHLTDGHAYAKELLDAWMQDPNASLPVRSRSERNATRRTARDKADLKGG
jgi:hypothetical protein